MNDTPISDSTPHNVAELGMLCRKLERELTAANDRIKQLEDRIHRAAMAFFEDVPDASIASGMLAILEEERKKP